MVHLRAKWVECFARWIDVPCADEDALVFLCGDYMSLLSKGRTK